MTTAQLGDSGITLGETDSEGVEWAWTGDDPWSPSPSPREVAGDRANDHGQWDATEFYGPRTVEIQGRAMGDHASLHRAKWRLNAAVTAALFQLRISEPDGDRQAWVRRGGDVLWAEEIPTRATWSVSLKQPDPLVRSLVENTITALPLPSTSGGLSAPFDAPFSVPATTTSGVGTVLNSGTVAAPMRAILNGPLEDAVITQPELGTVMILANPDGALLATGETLEIDSTRRRILLGGTVSRRSWMRGDWINFPPGSSEVRWDSSAFSAATFQPFWFDSWV